MGKQTEYTDEFCKCILTEKERKDLAEQMARNVAEAEDLERQKKAVAKDFDGRVESAKSTASSAARKLNDGYEMRNVRCLVERDQEEQVVRYIRTDNGEVARMRQMSAGELQMSLEDAA